jgi:TolA-binding protein
MAVLSRWILLWSVLFAVLPRLRAASAPEKNAFDAAVKAFQDTFWQRAETEFGAFAQTYTNSARLPEAFLYQAEARLKQTNYPGALELLAAHQDQAGKLTDLYVFWQAEILFQKGGFRPAADAFARLIREFPDSTNRLEAAVLEASAWSKLMAWPHVVEALQDVKGPFLHAATANATNELVSRGFLLLAEAQLSQTNCEAAEKALAPLAAFPLGPRLDWERQFLRCRIRMAAGQIAEAYQGSTNLVLLAAATGKKELQADTSAFQASLLERLGELSQALAAYQRNLADGVPPERQRQALMKVTELFLRQNQVAEAAQTLETFLTNSPAPESADLALATLGELRLRQFESGLCTNTAAITVSNPAPVSLCLTQAITALERFTNQFPTSPLLGRGELTLGWCFWEAGRIAASQDSLQVAAGRIAASQAAFQIAAQRLPYSPEQATAFFKLADAQYWLSNYTAAIVSYNVVVSNFETLPEVKTSLCEPALYHVVRAGLAAHNLEAANGAVSKLLANYPKGFYTDRSVLMTGQILGDRDPAGARKMFQDFLVASPQTALVSQLELAVAATYEQESQWDAAIHQYDEWLSSHTNHEAQASAEYARAWANYQAGRETNALVQFNTFIAHFPTNASAPLAQWWVADYYFALGDYYTAEQNYQWCYQNTNWPTSKLSFQAMMMAGRAAFARQGWKDAKDYFGKLASYTNCPAALRAQAFFALGDTLVSQASTNKQSDFKEALAAYDQVGWLCPSDAIAILAMGAKGNCFLQCQDYDGATNSFLQVIHSPLGNAAARSSAKVGLGVTLEKLAQQPACTNQNDLLVLARDQYLDVFYPDTFLREGERADPFWTMKAGLEAARLSEQLKDLEGVWKIYQRLHKDFPSLPLEDKMKALQAQQPLVRDEP